MSPKFSVAGGHGGKELFELADECFGLLAVRLNGSCGTGCRASRPTLSAKRQNSSCMMKRATASLSAWRARRLSFELGKLLGRLLGYADFERAGLELFGFLKDGAENIERRQVRAWDWSGEDQVVERELVDQRAGCW